MTADRTPGHHDGDQVGGVPAAQWTDQDLGRTVALLPALADYWAAPIAGPDRPGEVVVGMAEVEALVGRLPASPDRGQLLEVVAQGWHRLEAIAAAVAGHGVGTGAGSSPALVGVVERINRSGGGVPKEAVDEAAVTTSGIEGDQQRVRLHHGRPWQALSLWSREVIDELAGQGHPVSPGGAGENLTLAGLDWSVLHGGTVLVIGDGERRRPVEIQLSSPATPCATIADCFIDRQFPVIDHDRHPGRSRWYASVLTPGSIRAGDPVRSAPPRSR